MDDSIRCRWQNETERFTLFQSKKCFHQPTVARRGISSVAVQKVRLIGLIITDHAFHLAVKKGIYQSTDSGKQWTAFNDGFTFNETSTDEEISAVTSIGNTVFAATTRGVYRLNSGTWKKFPIKTRNAFDDFDSLAVSENNLYVAASPDFSQMMKSPEAKEAYYTKSITSNKVQWSHFSFNRLGRYVG